MLAEIPRPVRWDGGLALSPDGSTVLCAQIDKNESDLYAVSGYRV